MGAALAAIESQALSCSQTAYVTMIVGVPMLAEIIAIFNV